MKLRFVIALVCMGLASLAHAETSNPADDARVLKEFSTNATVPGAVLQLTLLTNRSMDALWRDDAARNTLGIEVFNSGTSFLVTGKSSGKFGPVTGVALVQDGKSTPAKIVNVSNLNGTEVPSGQKILGLLEFSSKVDLTKPFTVVVNDSSAKFSVTRDAAERWGAVTRPPGQGF
ncbi:hypothetical protein [Paraburkholderia fynbosensis]|uniref:Uncharacterized protein n=1 Tax=Paraburkholderia fynbosensis TaxID=1200993 RepID=A0A6J5H0X6_9BURK|nr:hypothetical protein [Paraburkholderia fynbosensis]CAB3809726.1 hypothetical protein LMG27177_06889 [Paraburkholderia fynbosensis]